MLYECCEVVVDIVMNDLLDEAKENGYDDDGFECFPENDQEDTDAEQVLDRHWGLMERKWTKVS